MSRLGGRGTHRKRLVLGFDGGCMGCVGLARRIEERLAGGRLAGRLEVLSLREPEVAEWRRAVLGEDAPLVPTLFEVRGEQVRAWTGLRMGAALGRFLGPAAAWQVMQVLGEVPGTGAGGTPVEGRAVVGLTRGQFLKGVGGAAVAMSVLSVAGKPAAAQAEEDTSGSTAPAEPTGPATVEDDAVGASIPRPEEWFVEREEYTLDDTYGFTLWKPEPASSRDSHDHGGTTPAVRVARARRLKPKEIEQKVRARIAAHPDLSMKRTGVSVGGKGYKGVAVGPIPGSTPSTEVYVPVENRVYQINVYGEELDADGRELLKALRFRRPSRSIDSLKLPDGKKGETHQKEDDAGLAERERAAREAVQEVEAPDQTITAAASSYGEYQTYEGCWVADSTFFFQTQHGKYANKRWGPSYTGWTIIGRPNYWGEYTHGDLGYGRCVSQSYTNDMYAIDYPLGRGDVIFSPFRGGTVTFAGRNYTHANYGLFVTIKADNGKYVSMSGHLNALAPGIRRGAYVTNKSIIGYAGNTGDPSIPVGETHLHQAYYRYPRYNPDGSPYGGAGLQVAYHHYVGTAAGTGRGIYTFGWTSNSTTWAKGDWISN